jgi:hypothetical protein
MSNRSEFWDITLRSALKVNRRFRVISPSDLFVAYLMFLSFSAYFSDLKMEAKYLSESLVDFRYNTRRYLQEDRTLHNHLYKNLKSYRPVI